MKTALLLIDIQNDYFEGGTMTLVGVEQASLNAKLVLKHFRAQNLPIIHVQHIAARPTATFFLPNTFGAEIHANVFPVNDEKVVVKHFPNSFRETDLLEYLQSHDISKLVICGMMTHMCVDATTRAAKDFGFECIIIGDACATKNLEIQGKDVKAENVHNSFLAALNYFYAEVTTAISFIKS